MRYSVEYWMSIGIGFFFLLLICFCLAVCRKRRVDERAIEEARRINNHGRTQPGLPQPGVQQTQHFQHMDNAGYGQGMNNLNDHSTMHSQYVIAEKGQYEGCDQGGSANPNVQPTQVQLQYLNPTGVTREQQPPQHTAFYNGHAYWLER